MMLYRVGDIDIDECRHRQYDAAFFASGYEKRATYIPRLLSPAAAGTVVVLGFEAFAHDSQRLENDAFFREAWLSSPRIVSANDETPIYELCRALPVGASGCVRLLVDYSSMSRLWYAGLLNWARFLPDVKEVVVDCVYSCGRYSEDRPQMVIDEILSLPGCEGGAMRLAKSVAVFGLGFDNFATLCVLDRLEPDLVYAYLAAPAADESYPAKVRALNEEMINTHARRGDAGSRNLLELPLGSVERSFGALAELVAPHVREADVTLIPMGPKPHVLASILLSLRFIEIACLRVSGRGDRPVQVEPTGRVVATRVHFRQQKETLSSCRPSV